MVTVDRRRLPRLRSAVAATPEQQPTGEKAQPMENSFDQHRERALFTTDAELYDDGRPGYPSEVFEIPENRCG